MDDGGREEVAAAQPDLVPSARGASLYDRAHAARWSLSREAFSGALERSARHAFAGSAPSAAEVGRYLDSLHLEDLALAAACAAGIDAAWEHFLLEHRPGLYRAAAAIDRTGGGRELADSLYGDLFGLRERDGERQSLFRYFHGRSSLGSWTRAVLAQRHIDRVRATRRLDPLPDDDGAGALAAPGEGSVQGQDSAYHVAMRTALVAALAALAPRDRLRLACYYAQNMRLAAIGRMLGEHEASVSRHLARARREIREAIERHLRTAGYDEGAIVECFRTVAGDSGSLDLGDLLEGAVPGKDLAPGRSQVRGDA